MNLSRDLVENLLYNQYRGEKIQQIWSIFWPSIMVTNQLTHISGWGLYTNETNMNWGVKIGQKINSREKIQPIWSMLLGSSIWSY